MSLVDRAKNVVTAPKAEWPLVAAEPATIGGLFTGYAIPLALLPLVGSIVGILIKGLSFASFLVLPLLVTYAIGLGILYLMAIIADALAPSFDGIRSQVQATKLVVYSATPVWLAGFIGGLLPTALAPLVFLLFLAGYGYAAYLLYLGAMAAMRVPQVKAAGYTAVVIIIWIILGMVVTGIIVGMVAAAFIGTAALGGAAMGL